MSHQPYTASSPARFGDIIRIVRTETVREELPLLATDRRGARRNRRRAWRDLCRQTVKEGSDGLDGAGESAIDPKTITL